MCSISRFKNVQKQLDSYVIINLQQNSDSEKSVILFKLIIC